MIDTPIRPEPAAALAPAPTRVSVPGPVPAQAVEQPLAHTEPAALPVEQPARPAPAPTGLLLCLKLAAVAVAAAAAALSAGFWLGWPDQLGTGALARPVLASWGAQATAAPSAQPTPTALPAPR